MRTQVFQPRTGFPTNIEREFRVLIKKNTKMPKHRSFTVKFKLQALDWHRQNGGNITQTAREFGVDRKRIREWLANEDLLMMHRRGSDAKKRRLGGGGQPVSQDLDMQVLDFLLDERAAGRPVSNRDLKEKAREFAQGDQNLANFQASDGWLRRWKKRNAVGIRRGTNESQKLPEDLAEKVHDFQQAVFRKRREHDYTMANIGNMDETMCRFDMLPGATNNVRGERDIRIASTGGSKKGFTVCLTATGNGGKKPALIVFKEARGVLPPRVAAQLRVPRNVRVTATINGWMTGDKMADYLQRIWGRNVDDVRRLFILDQARVHTMQRTKDGVEALDSDLIFVPAGCTPLLQPADVSWNKPFKDSMRDSYKRWRRQDLRTPAGNLKMASRQDVINWVSTAWDSVSEEVVMRSFKACGITSALDGSEDDLLSDRVAEALNAAEQAENPARDEAAGLLFDSDSDDADDDEF